MTKKILLVDDSATARLTTRLLFANNSAYQLISAYDGKEGVETAIEEHPDLILMDIEMPLMTGIEACALLKKNAATKDIPVVFLTTRSEPQWLQQARESGCSDFLIKPVKEDKLTEVFRKHLGV